MPQRVVPRLWTPSLKSGYARSAAESANPGLWRGLVGAWCPGLGITGLMLSDVSGRKSNGSLVVTDVSTAWKTTQFGYTFLSDRTTDYVDILNNKAGGHPFENLSDSITIVSTFNSDGFNSGPTTWAAANTILELRQRTTSSTNIPFAYGCDTNKIFLGVTDNYTAGDERLPGSTTLLVNTWYHYAAVVSGDDYALYLNGEIDASGTFSVATGDRSVGSTAADMQIGQRAKDSGVKDTDGFRGSIGNIFLYERALASSEIAALYRDPLAPFRLRPLTITLPAAAPATTKAYAVARNWTPSLKSGYARNAAESAHPGLWKGVHRFYYTLGSKLLRDYGPHNQQTTQPSANLVSKGGLQYLDFTSSWLPDATDDFISDPNKYTVLISFFRTDITTDSFWWMNATNNPFRLKSHSSTLLRWFFVDTTPSTKVIDHNIPDTEEPYHIIVRMDHNGAGLAESWLLPRNGSSIDKKSVATGAGFSKAGLGNFSWSSAGMIGLSSWAEWDRLLTDNEMEQVLRDPLAPFRLKPLTITLPAAAAGLSIPIAHYHYNHHLGTMG